MATDSAITAPVETSTSETNTTYEESAAEADDDHVEEALHRRTAATVLLEAVFARLQEAESGDEEANGDQPSRQHSRAHSAAPSRPSTRKTTRKSKTSSTQGSGLKCSGHIKVLALTAALFASITAAQTVGALIAHSMALLADCVSMGADALTYTLNIGVECLKGRPSHTAAELTVAAISMGILAYGTVMVTIEALGTLKGETDDGGEEVNAYIVLGFALGGIVFDIISLQAFLRHHKKTNSGKEMNMWTALMHVGADFVRSMSTFVSSMLMLILNFDTTKTDAWTTMVITFTLAIGVLAGVVAWFRKLFQCLCAKRK